MLAGLGVAHLHQTDFSLFLGAVLALAVLTVVAFVATARGGPDE